MGSNTSRSHRRCVPYWAPAWTYVETAPASLSASITIRPGPKTIRNVRACATHLLETRIGFAVVRVRTWFGSAWFIVTMGVFPNRETVWRYSFPQAHVQRV